MLPLTSNHHSEFTAVCTYHVNDGSAHVYSVVIDDVLYQGEGTTSKVAKAFAATKALEGIQVSEGDAKRV
jgi:dsRNA-specific ribonuclease